MLIFVYFRYPSTEEISAKEDNELIDSNHQTLNNADIAIKIDRTVCSYNKILYMYKVQEYSAQKKTYMIIRKGQTLCNNFI